MGRKVLDTERLYLEELDEYSLDDLYGLLSNEKVHMFFPKVLNFEESKEFLKKVQVKYQQDGTSFWGLFLKSTNTFIGICGILKQYIDNKEEYEVAYRLLDMYWGNGYATEAASACIEFAEKTLNAHTVIALIRDINLPSIRVAERCGLTFEKNTIFHDLPHRVYRLIWKV